MLHATDAQVVAVVAPSCDRSLRPQQKAVPDVVRTHA
jgi:hypothetical protein